jgi:hypothetical protein
MAIRKQDYLKTTAGRRMTLKGISLVRGPRKGDCTRVGRWGCMSHSFESHIGRTVESANAQTKLFRESVKCVSERERRFRQEIIERGNPNKMYEAR